MDKIYIFLIMVFLHIVDDYYLQGWLASAKQKKWWEQNAPQQIYKHDYIMALVMHSFSWSFMIMLPIAISLKFTFSWFYLIAFLINATVHGFVDNLKANKLKINLIQDQTIHIVQIIATVILYFVVI